MKPSTGILAIAALMSPVYPWLCAAASAALDVSPNYTVEETDRQWAEPPPSMDLRIVGRTETPGVVVYADDAQWILQSIDTTESFYGVGAGDQLFVAVAAGGMIYTSPDGMSWSARDSGVSDLLLNVSGDSSAFVAVGDNGRVLTSPDGMGWTARTSPTTELLRGIAFGNGVHVACGGNGTILRSTDGVAWSSVSSGTSEVLQGVAFGGDQFVVVGAGGVLLTSSDGQAWIARSSGTGTWLLDVTYGDGLYAAVGLNGVMRTSVDGVTWSSASSATTEHLYRVTYHDGRFVAVGANGTIVGSENGATWSAESSGVTSDLRGVAPRADLFAAVGFGGRVLIRQPIDDPPLPGDVVSAAAQPEGSLSDIIVFTSAGHGFSYNGTLDAWRPDRPLLHGMVEDMGNIDQMNMFAEYAFRGGATVVPFRPLGYQTNEVVLDNGDAGVTFGGVWHDSVSPIYYGNPDELPYRYAFINTTETSSWAIYRPDIPAAGFYPVYAWTRHGSDRVRQLYRVYHTGGVTDVRVNHRRVGNGWVWLGTYYFDAGTAGSVNISNQAPGENPGSNVVIADAIRFGNGMGDVPRGTAGVSGFERELESSRYWVQRMVGQGMSSTLYDNPSWADATDNIGAPPRMAAEMNRETDGSFWDRIYLGFHSNADGGAGTARGPMGLWDTRGTTLKQDRQKEYGLLMADEIHADMTWASGNSLFLDSYANNSANLYGSGYGEIYGSINDQMNSTIIETLFHNNATDANLLKDPVARRMMARSCYKAIVKHLNDNNAAVSRVLMPDPPGSLSVINSGPGAFTLRWTPPATTPASGDAPTGYVIYRSGNGYGFGNPIYVAGGATTQITLTNMPVDETFYFLVAATNSGGESRPSTVVGARVAPSGQARHLIVNGFERNDRTQSPVRYFANGLNGNVALVRQRRINSFDYIVQHGEALAAAGPYFDSCDNRALIAEDIDLLNYFAAYWILGRESTRDQTFNAAEQGLVQGFLDQGGRLLTSGTDIGWDLDHLGGPADKAFIENYLTVAYAADDSGSFWVTPNTGGLFDGLASFLFDDGSGPTYRAAFPDVYYTRGGAVSTLVYGQTAGGTQIAGVAYEGDWKSVVLGFPFETIRSAQVRNEFMARVANDFFGPDPFDDDPPPAFPPDPPVVLSAADVMEDSFAARWEASAGATHYWLDVSAHSSFSEGGSTLTTNGYHNGTLGSGTGGTWIETDVTQGTVSSRDYIQLKTGEVITPAFDFTQSATRSMVFEGATFGTVTEGRHDILVSVSINNGASWVVLGTNRPLSSAYVEYDYDLSAYEGSQVRVRFQSSSTATGSQYARLREIELTSLTEEGAYVSGYQNRLVGDVTSTSVTGLTQNTTYYYRLRAQNEAGISADSDIRMVTTLAGTAHYTTNSPVPVPHTWLEDHFGGGIDFEAVALQRTDSGMLVWQEYVAGTDPTDADSRLVAEAVPAATGGFPEIRWLGTDQPNRTYSVHRTTNLTTPMTPLQSNILPQHPVMNVYTDTTYEADGPAYYRVRVTLEE